MVLDALNEGLWSLLFLPLFLVCSLCLLLRSGGIVYRRFGTVLRLPFDKHQQTGSVTPAQAASSSLAATVGTGNIVGTAQALAMGGPGAVFWLWIAALLGMTVKTAEILLGQRYRSGAMGYIKEAMGKGIALLYAGLAVFSTLTVGNMAQMNGAVSAICGAVGRDSQGLRLCTGAVLIGILAWALFRGKNGVIRICDKLVPPMAVGYLILTNSVLISFSEKISEVFRSILASAFTTRAAAGAAGGECLRQTILWGLRRGAFSNEAGLGTAANIHSAAGCDDLIRHGMWGAFEVFADTLILCTITAFTILCSGAEIRSGSLPGPELLQQALSVRIGNGLSSACVAVFLLLFGFSTVLGCAVGGQRCAEWIAGRKAGLIFRWAYLSCALLGCLLPVDLIWQTADTVNVLLSVPNLLSLWILAPELQRMLRRKPPLDEKVESAILNTLD